MAYGESVEIYQNFFGVFPQKIKDNRVCVSIKETYSSVRMELLVEQ